MKSNIPIHYQNEKLADHWNVDETRESFNRLQNHINITTNFRYFFEKEISNPNLLILPEGMVVADIGAGNGWSSSLLALRPEISKVYAIEPSKSRLERIPYVAKHFGVPDGKIECIEGSFLNLNLQKKVHLACLSSSFHHCFDNQMEEMLNNVKKILLEERIYKFKNYNDEIISIKYKSKILLASEHYVDWRFTMLKFLSYFKKRIFSIFNQKKTSLQYGNWRTPNEETGEHWRTKKEILQFIEKANLKIKFFDHDGDICVSENWNKVNKILKYYYAILENK